MLLDDDEISLFLTRKILQKQGFCGAINEFVSAHKALLFLERFSDKDQYPDLIILDVNMPLMNGFDFLDSLYQINPDFKNIKICILTSASEHLELEAVKKYANIVEFITKPMRYSNCEQLLVRYKLKNL